MLFYAVLYSYVGISAETRNQDVMLPDGSPSWLPADAGPATNASSGSVRPVPGIAAVIRYSPSRQLAQLGAQFDAIGQGPFLSITRLHQQRHQPRYLRDLITDTGFLALVECFRAA
jgi:hypothetical protein